MTDEITLTLPRHKPFYRIAHLVLGGLAVRQNITFEHLEDLQLGLAGLLDHRPEDAGDITVRVRLEGDTVSTAIGPFEEDVLSRELDAHRDEDDVTLRRLLDTGADRVEVRDGESGKWVELTKTVETVH